MSAESDTTGGVRAAGGASLLELDPNRIDVSLRRKRNLLLLLLLLLALCKPILNRKSSCRVSYLLTDCLVLVDM